MKNKQVVSFRKKSEHYWPLKNLLDEVLKEEISNNEIMSLKSIYRRPKDYEMLLSKKIRQKYLIGLIKTAIENIESEYETIEVKCGSVAKEIVWKNCIELEEQKELAKEYKVSVDTIKRKIPKWIKEIAQQGESQNEAVCDTNESKNKIFETFKMLARNVRYLEQKNCQINYQIEELENFLYNPHAINLERIITTKPNAQDNSSRIIKYGEKLEELRHEKEKNNKVIEFVEKTIEMCEAPYNIYFAYKYYYGESFSNLQDITGTHRKNIYEGIKKEIQSVVNEEEMNQVINDCEYLKKEN